LSDQKADPGQPNRDSIRLTARRLAFVKGLALPAAACPDLNGLYRARFPGHKVTVKRRSS
jgi:hypothetical protein